MSHPGQSTPLAKPFCSSFTAQEPLRPQQFVSLPTRHSCHSNIGNRPWQTLCSSIKSVAHGPGATQATAICVTSHGPLMPQQSRSSAAADRVQFQQVSEAVPVSFYGRSRLPFARLQTRLQLGHRPRATEATAISVTSHRPLMRQHSRGRPCAGPTSL